MRYSHGDRVGAIRDATAEVVHAFGFGTYQGEEVPPEDVMGPLETRLGLYGRKNPKLLMDDGTVVWGCECWWGTEDKVRKMIGSRPVEIVQPDRSPATDEERQEAVEITARAAVMIAEMIQAKKCNT